MQKPPQAKQTSMRTNIRKHTCEDTNVRNEYFTEKMLTPTETATDICWRSKAQYFYCQLKRVFTSVLDAQQLLGFRDKGELKATKFYLHNSKSKFALLHFLLCQNALKGSELVILLITYLTILLQMFSGDTRFCCGTKKG